MSQIILKLASVIKLIFIVFLSFAAFLIILKKASVQSSIGVFQHSFPMPLAVHEFAMIMVAVDPIVISYPTWDVLLEASCIDLAILESNCAVSPFHEVFEFALVACSWLDQYSEPFNHIMMPLAYIG